MALIVIAFMSAMRVLVVPRSSRDRVARIVFLAVRRALTFWVWRSASYYRADRLMAWYAPSALLALVFVWLVLVLIGYTSVFLALGAHNVHDALTLSGSSLLTLGFASPGEALGRTLVSFTESATGLVLIALLIAYLPTIYSAFSRREASVGMLEVRAGSPPSAVELLARYNRIHGLDELGELWTRWEQWFQELEETHTSLAALNFFRSPSPERSWITAAGTVLDSASLAASSLNIPRNPRAELCIRAGYLALRHIAVFFSIPHNPEPRPDDPISISRAEFDDVYSRLRSEGVPLKSDIDQCWRDFAGWRVNYDATLLALAQLTMAPVAEWVSDRGPLEQPRG